LFLNYTAEVYTMWQTQCLSGLSRATAGRGPRKHSRGASKNMFAEPIWGEMFGIFLFKMVILVHFCITERWRAPQTSRGPG